MDLGRPTYSGCRYRGKTYVRLCVSASSGKPVAFRRCTIIRSLSLGGWRRYCVWNGLHAKPIVKNPVGGWNRYWGNIHLYVWGLSVYTIGRNHDRVEPCLNLGCFCSDGYFPRDMGRKPSGIYLHRTCGVLDSPDAICHSFRAISCLSYLVVSRIREFAAAGYSTQDAIREGVTRTAGVITSAAVLL